LLKENPDSVLWLATVDGIVTENLRKESEARGVSPDRLVFAERMLDKTEHLARLAHADIAFDTRRFNGHQTTMDALFAGLPLVSSEGRHFPSRVSASMLRAAGLAELITSNIEEYAALARRLAADPALRQSIRDRLLRNRESSPLFDTAASARSLEAAYREMWRRYAAGERPRAFAVADIAAAAD
jgi:predicted O-linked N-acetylglucosamine transferase (SPINDLY family)